MSAGSRQSHFSRKVTKKSKQPFFTFTWECKIRKEKRIFAENIKTGFACLLKFPVY